MTCQTFLNAMLLNALNICDIYWWHDGLVCIDIKLSWISVYWKLTVYFVALSLTLSQEYTRVLVTHLMNIMIDKSYIKEICRRLSSL